jgi:hypothetical protein
LEGRGDDSSDASLALPLPVLVSRDRLDLSEFVVARVVRDTIISRGAVEGEGWSAGSYSLSLALSFCFAALTLALERRALDSAEEGEAEDND